jgi:hypothetical protein
MRVGIRDGAPRRALMRVRVDCRMSETHTGRWTIHTPHWQTSRVERMWIGGRKSNPRHHRLGLKNATDRRLREPFPFWGLADIRVGGRRPKQRR